MQNPNENKKPAPLPTDGAAPQNKPRRRRPKNSGQSKPEGTGGKPIAAPPPVKTERAEKTERPERPRRPERQERPIKPPFKLSEELLQIYNERPRQNDNPLPRAKVNFSEMNEDDEKILSDIIKKAITAK